MPCAPILVHRERYDRFVAAMVYGERVEFVEAMRTVAELAADMLASFANDQP